MIGIGPYLRPRPSFSSGDADAAAFLSAAGITGATETAAVNTLVTSLKGYGIWSKMKAVYPFVTDNRNLLGYTEDFGNAAWISSEVAIASNSTTAPDGTLTADTLTASTTNAAHYIYQSINTNSGSTVTFSFFVKNNGGNYVQLLSGGISFTISNPYQNFDLINGTLAQGNIPSSTIQNAGNGWYRISISIEASASGSAGYFLCPILNGTTGRLDAFTGNGTSGVYIWGAQLELGSTATTYQPITTTQQSYISSQFKYNLKDPRDLDAAFRLVFNGGWTHSSTGATPNGTNGYADTFFNPNSSLTYNSAHISFYSRTNNETSGSSTMGAVDTVNNEIRLILRRPTNLGYFLSTDSANGILDYTITNSTGLFTGNANGVNVRKLIRNGSALTPLSQNPRGTGIWPSVKIYIGSRSLANVAGEYDNKECAFSSIGDGLSDTEASNLYTAVQAFQTSLSRQV